VVGITNQGVKLLLILVGYRHCAPQHKQKFSSLKLSKQSLSVLQWLDKTLSYIASLMLSAPTIPMDLLGYVTLATKSVMATV